MLDSHAQHWPALSHLPGNMGKLLLGRRRIRFVVKHRNSLAARVVADDTDECDDRPGAGVRNKLRHAFGI